MKRVPREVRIPPDRREEFIRHQRMRAPEAPEGMVIRDQLKFANSSDLGAIVRLQWRREPDA